MAAISNFIGSNKQILYGTWERKTFPSKEAIYFIILKHAEELLITVYGKIWKNKKYQIPHIWTFEWEREKKRGTLL